MSICVVVEVGRSLCGVHLRNDEIGKGSRG